MISKGKKQIVKIFLGNKPIKEVYLGSKLLFSSIINSLNKYLKIIASLNGRIDASMGLKPVDSIKMIINQKIPFQPLSSLLAYSYLAVAMSIQTLIKYTPTIDCTISPHEAKPMMIKDTIIGSLQHDLSIKPAQACTMSQNINIPIAITPITNANCVNETIKPVINDKITNDIQCNCAVTVSFPNLVETDNIIIKQSYDAHQTDNTLEVI